jgi:ribosomal protein L37AE/L43A
MPVKPSKLEEEYIAKEELERKKKLAAENQKKMMEEERKRLKELHFMHCPKCGMKMVEVDYKNIKIDQCSECGGVWLDKGELEQVSVMEKKGLERLFGIFK